VSSTFSLHCRLQHYILMSHYVFVMTFYFFIEHLWNIYFYGILFFMNTMLVISLSNQPQEKLFGWALHIFESRDFTSPQLLYVLADYRCMNCWPSLLPPSHHTLRMTLSSGSRRNPRCCRGPTATTLTRPSSTTRSTTPSGCWRRP